MKNKKGLMFWEVLLFTLLLAGCSQTESAQIVSPGTSTEVIEVTDTIIKPTPILETYTSTPMDTPLATLTYDDAKGRVIELIKTNGNCEFPCLWNITPGKTSPIIAANELGALQPFSRRMVFSSSLSLGEAGFSFTNGNYEYRASVSYVATSERSNVEIIEFNAGSYLDIIDTNTGMKTPQQVYNLPDFGSQFTYYEISNILKTYGEPESVLLFVTAYSESNGTFEVLLIYPNKGFSVRYITDITASGGEYLGCFGNAHIEAEMYPAGDSVLFFQLLQPSMKTRLRNYKPIEDVTSLSLDAFYRSFQQNSNNCISTSMKNFPTVAPGGE